MRHSGSGRQRAAQALTWALLAIPVLTVYLVVVAGGGRLLGRDGPDPDLLLSVLATGLVAVGLEPARARLAGVTRTLLRVEQATPYDTLRRLSAQAAGAYGVDEVLPRTAQVLAEGTGAHTAEVWLLDGAGLRCAARWPTDADPWSGLTLTAQGRLVPDPAAAAVVGVRHGGELLGALVVRRGDRALAPVERTLLSDLADQAGLVLRNVLLTGELAGGLRLLSDRAAELTASRARLVAAQTTERRRLERDIHDGAQQHLVALAVNLTLAQTLLARSPDRARAVLSGLRDAAAEAERTLLDLARGVFPAVLSSEGLLPALREAARAAPVAVTVEGAAPRYPEDVEVAAYFSCLEGVQNAVKHAGASAVQVVVTGEPTRLRFEVRDDGVGFDPVGTPRGSGLAGVEDRLGCLGGSVRVVSCPGAGTVLYGELPLGLAVAR